MNKIIVNSKVFSRQELIEEHHLFLYFQEPR